MTIAAGELRTADTPTQSRNHLLAVLPVSEFLELRPMLTLVRLAAKARLAEPNRPIDAVYFPLDAVISVSASDETGEAVEVGSIGCEGMVGLPVLFGAGRSTSGAMVQIAGEAERMDAANAPTGGEPESDVSAPAPPVRAGIFDPGGPEHRVQPAPPGGAAACPLAPDLPRPNRTRGHPHHPRDDGGSCSECAAPL